jgi:hypothetical protein
MDPERLIELFGTELSDEAAATLADFFHELAMCFEDCYYSQIRRHYLESFPQPDDDPQFGAQPQLDFFDSIDDPF